MVYPVDPWTVQALVCQPFTLLKICSSAFTDSAHCRSCSTVVCVQWNKVAYKWTHAIETHVVQGSTVPAIEYYSARKGMKYWYMDVPWKHANQKKTNIKGHIFNFFQVFIVGRSIKRSTYKGRILGKVS